MRVLAGMRNVSVEAIDGKPTPLVLGAVAARRKIRTHKRIPARPNHPEQDAIVSDNGN